MAAIFGDVHGSMSAMRDRSSLLIDTLRRMGDGITSADAMHADAEAWPLEQ
ncbi:hypothetical protein [Novosphingopyxis sp. YJ-S2-01]|uniref:hypothetical protein n=1 Tax=Novosphingopyxis sp. YJ-S2-01 TaxID=2794021 RepID=UPI0018DE474B|nr:hypothetical protein [Novosphingopyxis sp. YJ-S2-01]MBH9537747.1 hypothetical protein [Novosphingopyxis sp. YJ-S2-01]